METKIFISYRRQDADASAGRLYDTMRRNYNPESLFKDIDSIPLGTDFKKIIESKIRECNIVLAIIGKNFTKIKDEDGALRIFNPEDLVNMELSTAIKEKKIVIPVLVDNAVIPKESELPESLHKLPYLNGIKLSHDSWTRDTGKLIAEISKIIDRIKFDLKLYENNKKNDSIYNIEPSELEQFIINNLRNLGFELHEKWGDDYYYIDENIVLDEVNYFFWHISKKRLVMYTKSMGGVQYYGPFKIQVEDILSIKNSLDLRLKKL